MVTMSAIRGRASGCLTLLWGQREAIVALSLGLWLTGYWLLEGWEARKMLWILVPVLVLFGGDRIVLTVRRNRWLWAVAGLLLYQLSSRMWTAQSTSPVASWHDSLLTFVLIAALVTAATRENVAPRFMGGLAILSPLVAIFSLFGFYLLGGHSFADDRLRIPHIHDHGLNAVLTGLLFGFGALVAAWFTRHGDWRTRRVWWLAATGTGVFALLATQSRGAMLALAAGTVALLFFERSRARAALGAMGGGAVAYFAVLFWSRGGSDAAGDLLVRGSTGRFAIYDWFLGRMDTADGLVGKGMGTPAVIPEEVFGWLVHHPHSSYLTQLYLTGAVGLGLLIFVLGWATRDALREARHGDTLWVTLLASGTVALLFDCAQIFTLHSDPRLELLLLAVPAALASGRVESARAD